uniref:3-hydroxyacyl-CoA dehydrogenase NAD-binding domain-containing protein n=1 Tax=Castellaniella defragrans TaxID=75697 RepID=UPI00333E6E86
MTIQYECHGDVALIRLAHPPVNSLDFGTRQALWQALQRAGGDAAVRAVVLAGAARAFSSGADITEFGSPAVYREPNLGSLVEALDGFGKPVVAALEGLALGGGLELALACHYRIAARDCKVGFPEIRLGLVPGAGGTQRLPRALGVEAALNLIQGGRVVRAAALAQIPGQTLFHQLVDDTASLDDAALLLARDAAERHANGAPLPRLAGLVCAHPCADAYFQFARTALKSTAQSQPALLQSVDLIEAACRHRFTEGLARELQCFKALEATPQSAALRHMFLAERMAGKVSGVDASTLRRRIESVAVVGAGTMGTGIAMCFLDAGLPVVLLEADAQALDRGLAAIRKVYHDQAAKGRLAQDALERRLANLHGALDDAALARADLIIEAVFEDMAVKESVFRRLDAVARPGAILASNTSTLDLDRIAGFTGRPGDVVGLHFFSPAHVMKLLEVVRGAATADDVMATVMDLGRRIGKTSVVSGVCDGFIGNRMLAPYLRQAEFLLEDGCTPEQVDGAMERFGFAMGPFRMTDMAGNDIGWHIRKRLRVEQPQLRQSRLPDALCEAGRLGQKVSAGWYDYAPGRRQPMPSPVVQALIEGHREAAGIRARHVDDAEIVQRLVLALVNEGARILEEGIAARAGDIDIVYCTGYGFPAWRGGPMHYADRFGLFRLAETMRRFAAAPGADAVFWRPAGLIERLAADGETFNH